MQYNDTMKRGMARMRATIAADSPIACSVFVSLYREISTDAMELSLARYSVCSSVLILTIPNRGLPPIVESGSISEPVVTTFILFG